MWYVTPEGHPPGPHRSWSFVTCAEAATKAAHWVEVGLYDVLTIWHSGHLMATIRPRRRMPGTWVWGSA
jgi:hypothetical protein